ncbi:hypothetical protein M4914_20490 [Streptomyces somaliensis DSM 40738]|uniref:Uncharacterized protein n=1 Tax=Streptomyces somaliensis (strain ATCC 33201 / DSM 40738 / JCM 12659 / KCTC 9044 / NCTC 11332 / NRRL B-12077 / IP 733) TaxID=1134445 RepID=A0AA44DAE9_STRE0|nr:hypothetical protein [Streptomyces somaliensis]MCQ0025078.1 hypothetical protein [Streptomyces somaliensis DSM 40738]NKY13141.1 hypothetical protein [Streptomyces somaliensis DSM 40738]
MTISEPAARPTSPREADAETNRQLTALEGWRKFTAGPPQPPVLLTLAELGKLSPVERALYDEDRLDYGDEWKGLVATMEQTLLLHDHPPGSLIKLNRYLHKRTDGMIGALSCAIRGAAILNGTERVTKNGLDAVPLDHAAETPKKNQLK